MDTLGKTFALTIVFLLLTPLVIVQPTLAQTTAPPVLTYFLFDPISDQTAGVPFRVTIRARDQYDRPFTSYTGQNTLSAKSLVSQTMYNEDLGLTGNFVNGVWSGEITLNIGGGTTWIKTSGEGKTTEDDGFLVSGPPLTSVLDHFDYNPIGNQTVGVPFNITITAKDQYDNLFANYSGQNTLQSTLLFAYTFYYENLGVTGNFVNGVWSGEITLSRGSSSTIINTGGGGKYGGSPHFFVDGPSLPPVIDHFEFDYISSPQTVGVPFKITITAIDQYNQTLTSYSGTNTIGATEYNTHILDLSKWHSISLGATGAFVNGVWNGQVSIPEAFGCWVISTSGGGKRGDSKGFSVIDPAHSSSPIPTPFPTPKSNESLPNIFLRGNITNSIKNLTRPANQSLDTPILSFSVSGQSGDAGFGNVTIPKIMVMYGEIPIVYIDNERCLNQSFAQDTDNYYVWFTVHFSTHQVSINFISNAPVPDITALPNPSVQQFNFLQIILGVGVALAIVTVIIVVLMLVVRRKGNTFLWGNLNLN
jgi:hypothetical protein